MLTSRASRLALVPLVVLIIALALPVMALADDGTGGRTSIFESVTVGAGEVIDGDVGSIFSSVTVLGKVNGNVFSIFSSVSVSGQGQVTGNAFSVFSSVDVSDSAVVQGDATTVFSTVNVTPPARVQGTRSSGFGDVNIEIPSSRGFHFGSWNWMGNIFSGVFSALILAAFGVVAVALFPRRVEIVRDTLVHNPGASLGVGFLGLILVPPLMLILIITCIGPVILGLAAFFATLLGVIAVGLLVGQRVMESSNAPSRSMVTDVVVGSLIIVLILTALNAIPVICCIGWIASLGLFSWALGAVLLSRFGSVPPTVMTVPGGLMPMTPPMPPAPPASSMGQTGMTETPAPPTPPASSTGQTGMTETPAPPTPPAPPAGEGDTTPPTPPSPAQ